MAMALHNIKNSLFFHFLKKIHKKLLKVSKNYCINWKKVVTLTEIYIKRGDVRFMSSSRTYEELMKS